MRCSSVRRERSARATACSLQDTAAPMTLKHTVKAITSDYLTGGALARCAAAACGASVRLAQLLAPCQVVHSSTNAFNNDIQALLLAA
jgi:hypothetical protein